MGRSPKAHQPSSPVRMGVEPPPGPRFVPIISRPMARQGYPERPDEKREERGFNTEHTNFLRNCKLIKYNNKFNYNYIIYIYIFTLNDAAGWHAL